MDNCFIESSKIGIYFTNNNQTNIDIFYLLLIYLYFR